MTDVIVRFVDINDAESLLKIYAPYVLATKISCECEVPSIEEFKNRIEKISAKFPYVVIEIDGEIVGYSYSSLHKERAGYRWDGDATIYVSQKYHRNKIGTALYDCMLELTKLMGFYNMYAVVTASNEASVKFHKAFGFTEMGTYKNTAYKLGEWFDIMVLEKTLNEYEDEPEETKSIKEIDKDGIDKLFADARALVASTFDK